MIIVSKSIDPPHSPHLMNLIMNKRNPNSLKWKERVKTGHWHARLRRSSWVGQIHNRPIIRTINLIGIGKIIGIDAKMVFLVLAVYPHDLAIPCPTENQHKNAEILVRSIWQPPIHHLHHAERKKQNTRFHCNSWLISKPSILTKQIKEIINLITNICLF